MRRALGGLLLAPATLSALAACTRSAPPDLPVPSGSAAEPIAVLVPAASPTPTASATLAIPAPRPRAPREPAVVGRELVDLETMTPVGTVASKIVFAHALTSDTAYVWTTDEVRAFDLAAGSLRWKALAAECWHLAATKAGAFCGTSSGARWFRARDGAPATAGAAAGVTSLATLGARLVVIHSNKKIEAIDESGAVVGTTTAPFLPDSSRAGRESIGGSLFCGAQRSDAACNVFCVDATPRVVWTKQVRVPGGMLTQVDGDALVVSSDTWAKAPAGEILRTADGTTVMHSNHRFAAALSSNGIVERALSVDPVTLYDAKGATRWTWTGASSHHDAMRALRDGRNIVLALYSPIATGTRLVALNETTGALAWEADVGSLPIAHSKYSNEVELRATAAGSFLLRGHESSQDYAQTFDASTGKRLASILRRR